jgi:Zn-dependent protease with chaperone function
MTPASFEAHFSDGRTAARRRVTVRLGEVALVIEPQVGDDGRALSWAFDDLRLVDQVRAGQPLRLINGAQSDARLSFADDAVLEPLLARAPYLRPSGPLGRRPGLRLAQWSAGVGAVLAILFIGLPRAAEPVAALMPLSWEEALGKQVVGGFAAHNKFCNRSTGGAALDRLTDRLAATIDSRYSFRVAVADAGPVNAFAAPGGYIVLYRGLLESAGSSDEVAGVLAHEIGHVVARHGTESIVRAAGLAAMVQLLLGDPSGLLGIGVAGGEMLLSLTYSREDEAEADAIAVSMLNAAGIGTAGFANFLQRTARTKETAGGDSGMGFLSTHPRSAERAAAVGAEAVPGGPAMTETDWWELRKICATH